MTLVRVYDFPLRVNGSRCYRAKLDRKLLPLMEEVPTVRGSQIVWTAGIALAVVLGVEAYKAKKG